MSAYNKITISTLTHRYLVDNYLKGVPIVDRAGNPFPGPTIQTHINSAITFTEHFLKLPLKQKIVKSRPVDAGLVLGTDYDEMIERMPYNRDMARNFFQIKLPHTNIVSVERIRGFLNSESPAVSVDINTVIIAYPKNGTIHIRPMGSILGIIGGGVSLANTQQYYMIMNSETFPCFWGVDYTIGPSIGSRSSGNLGGSEFKAGVSYIDDMIVEYICKKAAITVLNMASTANKPGISSQSVAVDGFSRSTSYTSSATYALYSAHIEEYRKDLKAMEPELIKLFKPIRIQ